MALAFSLAAFPELTAGAYPGAITGDTMRHKAA